LVVALFVGAILLVDVVYEFDMFDVGCPMVMSLRVHRNDGTLFSYLEVQSLFISKNTEVFVVGFV
jgi:hypothetical protein